MTMRSIWDLTAFFISWVSQEPPLPFSLLLLLSLINEFCCCETSCRGPAQLTAVEDDGAIGEY